MLTTTKISLSWSWLIILTLVSVGLGRFLEEPAIFVLSVLFIVFLKGQQIVDKFMELEHAPRIWRVAFLCYVFILPGVISLIYIL
ncbi:cytochrome C oxidase subunit IV family protein [Thalassotalea atypica]|uniref:cytochrome C oxidase subunit IV family protein n=1 Tax=Thalassotalea atypica TaxID=2054316 RepID=UPI0025735D39|nr:cytochrome C oxidase subunit IV family protein [Thalassotalea atypica]